MSYSRFLKKKKLKKNKNGDTLCRYCESPVKYPRRTLCSDECAHEYRLRTYAPYLRQCVFKRDKGVCAHCGVDTLSLRKEGKSILKKFGKESYNLFCKSLGFDPRRKIGTEAHHVIPVCMGGGACGLSNIISICPSCHKIETAKLFKARKQNIRL